VDAQTNSWAFGELDCGAGPRARGNGRDRPACATLHTSASSSASFDQLVRTGKQLIRPPATGIFAKLVHCGQLILCGERNYAIALSVEVWVGCDKECPDPLLEKHSESRAQFGIVPLPTRDGAAILSQPG
jgi:hypothetical protein